MIVSVENAQVAGLIQAIPSKSYAHRIAICDFLAGNPTTEIPYGFTSKDIEVTKDCLARIKQGKTILDCGESGSALRFLLPLCAVIGGEFEFIGQGRLMQRPNQELFSVFFKHGVSAEQNQTVRIKGKLSSGEFVLRGDISSQYISGLLMALPVLDGDSRIVLSTPLFSASYVEITLEVLKNYGIVVEREKNGFYIKGGQKYFGRSVIEGDWSNTAFFMVLGALCGDITVTGLNLNSVQGDRAILEILKLAGANLDLSGGKIRVCKSALKGFTVDANDCPDLVPITAVLGAYAQGVTIIKSVERLKLKESDRIESTLAMLNAFNIEAHSDGRQIVIYGGVPTANEIDSFNDHRIAMASAVLACGATGRSIITGADAVNKTYPSFYKDFNSVGGKTIEI